MFLFFSSSLTGENEIEQRMKNITCQTYYQKRFLNISKKFAHHNTTSLGTGKRKIPEVLERENYPGTGKKTDLGKGKKVKMNNGTLEGCWFTTGWEGSAEKISPEN